MALRLYNTMGREMQDFIPLGESQVGFYSCGPTVYNYPHIGNLRAFVFDDVLARSLRFLGYPVRHVMNITDVGHLTSDADSGDDKMKKSAAEKGKSVWEIAEFYIGAFKADLERLNIRLPNVLCRATEHIGEMIDLIRRIEAKGYTYAAGGNLYFDVSKFPGYGRLALLKPGEQRARVGADEHKRNSQDFVLWFTNSKFSGQDMTWESPWGRGYPGWHIECSAMSMKYLGERFDIHSGGIDHIPVHHTNEIAQSEAATGQAWVNYWVHNEFLLMGGAKMSKSLGGFVTLSDLIAEGFDALDYRYFLLGGHYRSQLSFTPEALRGARASRLSLMERLRQIKERAQGSPRDDGAGQAYLQAFKAQIEDDINTPRALAELWALVKDPVANPQAQLGAARSMDEVLGLSLLTEAGISGEETAWADEMLAQRSQAKSSKDYARADSIRAQMLARGFLVEDGPQGSSWRRKL